MTSSGGVAFSVNFVELENWNDTSEKRDYIKRTYQIWNRGTFTKKVRAAIGHSSSDVFKLRQGSREQNISAGLSTPVELLFAPEKAEVYHGVIEIFDGESLVQTVPITASPPFPCIEVVPKDLDLGTQVNENGYASKDLIITNTGNKIGSFEVVTKSSHLEVSPWKGTLDCNQSLDVTVRLLCNFIGKVADDIKFNFEDGSSCIVSVKCSIVQRQLQLLNVTNQSCVMNKLIFSNIFFGDYDIQKVVLYNNGPVISNFKVVLEKEKSHSIAIGGSLAIAMTNQDASQQISNVEDTFQVSPCEGVLSPYQKTVITFRFTPQPSEKQLGWKSCQTVVVPREYSAMINVLLDHSCHSTASIALSATARPVSFKVNRRSINFGTCVFGSVTLKYIEIDNLSDILPIKFKCKDLANYKISPPSGIIKAEGKISIEVTFQPKQLGFITNQILVDLCASKSSRSSPLTAEKILVKGNCIAAQKKKQFIIPRIASVNDLAQSIRPPTQSSEVRTLYTRKSRHSYHDDNYQLEEEEMKNKIYNKASYITYLRLQTSERILKQKEKILRNCRDQDLGICSRIGVESPIPRLESTNDLSQFPSHSSALQMSDKESVVYIDCSQVLVRDLKSTVRYHSTVQPSQLKNIVIDPCKLNFGKICPNATAERMVTIINKTKNKVLIKIEINNDQIQFSFVPERRTIAILLKPSSYTTISLKFSPTTNVNKFESCLSYSIDDQHLYSIPITATLMELSVFVSPKVVKIYQERSFSTSSELWGTVQLTNPFDIPINYKWDPGKDELDINHLFPVNANGIIPPKADLICGFVYSLDFSLSSCMKCDLYINSASSCKPHLCTNVNFMTILKPPQCLANQKRVLFSNIPVNLVSSRTLQLENKGDCHAYFKVLIDSNNVNIEVSPLSGFIPANGGLELLISVHPVTSCSFDIDLTVAIREASSINVKVTGLAELPNLFVEQEVFDFGGILCGSSKSLPYTIVNKSCCRAQVTYDFSCLPDFTISTIQHQDDSFKIITTKSVLILELPGKSTFMCELKFKPSQVASYNFFLTVLVNGLLPGSPPGSPWPPNGPHSSISIANYGLPDVLSHTPIRQVLSTALLSPLSVCNNNIEFVIPPVPGLPKTPIIYHEKIILENKSHEVISWRLDMPKSDTLDNGTFKLIETTTRQVILPPSLPKPVLPGEKSELHVLFKPESFGHFSENIPVLLNEIEMPYCFLCIKGNLTFCSVYTCPSHIVFDPVPIGVTIKQEFLIVLKGFVGRIELDVQLPEFEDEIFCSVKFPNINDTMTSKGYITEHPCVLEFRSLKPVSMTNLITILETTSGTRVSVPISVTTDNSIFSVYEFLAQNLNPVVTFSEERAPYFHFNSPSSPQLCDTAASVSDYKEIYFKDCVSSICRWITCNGFSKTRCVNSPCDFCSEVVKVTSNVKGKEHSFAKKSKGMLVDLLTHLCGRLPPGIPLNLPPCTTNLDKVIQEYSTYDTVLTFLKNQGAVLAGVLPESLLKYEDCQEWLDQKFKDTDFIECSDKLSFQKLSNKSWTKVLMQVIKVLVIPRLLSKGSNKELFSGLDVESNLYSLYEMKLLLWLNFHFKLHRETLFGSQNSSVKVRHLVRFDIDLMDSMALSCVLYSYCPFLKSSHFNRLFVEPSTQEQCSHNALILIDALRTISFCYDIQPSDLLSPNPVFIVLFCSHLYSTLPSYKPSKEINFSTKLGKKINSKIIVSNLSSKKIDYAVLVFGEGSHHFSCSSKISILPKKKEELNINFTCYSLQPKGATLILVALNKHSIGTIWSYLLHGNCTGATPKIHKISSAHLYETISIEFSVAKWLKSPDQISDVKLTEIERVFISDEKVVPSSTLLSDCSGKVRMFCCNDVSDMIRLHFIGLKLGIHKCYAVLTTTDHDDYVLSATVEVKDPLPTLPQVASRSYPTTVNTVTKTLHFNAAVGEVVTEELVIHSSNEALENALVHMSTWELKKEDLNKLTQTDTLKFAALSNKYSCLFENNLCSISDNNLNFSIETLGSQTFELQSVVNVPLNGSSKFPVKFSSSKEGQYECHILLKSGLDIRLFVIEATVFPSNNRVQVEFKTNATIPLTQKIPLVNPTTSNWIFNASTDNSKFSGPELLEIPSLSTLCYPLTFNTQKEGKFLGKLHLTNTRDLSKRIFDLIGQAEKPSAQDSISLQTQVGRRQTLLIQVPNHKDRTVTFNVSSDIDFISGPKQLIVGGDDIADYCITIIPKNSGSFTGALVLKSIEMDSSCKPGADKCDDSSYHIWYAILCEVEPNLPVKTITATCPVLSSKELVIDVHKNMVLEELKVTIDCQYLAGSSTCPSEETQYTMIFKPFCTGLYRGRVFFSSSEENEFWYEVCLEAVDPDVIVIPPLICEIGRKCDRELILHNPLDKEVFFSCNNSNTRHYYVGGLAQGNICVGPQSQQGIKLTFNPSTLESNGHNAELAFNSYELGKQVYSVLGKGIAPFKPVNVKMVSVLDSSNSHALSFSNPLRTTATLLMTLEGKHSDSFTIFKEQTSSHTYLQSGQSIDLALVFTPTRMHLHEVDFVISTEMSCECDSCESEIGCKERHKLCWKYKITGQPRVILTPFERAPLLIATAKTVMNRWIIVQLNNFTSIKNVKISKTNHDHNCSGLGSNMDYFFEIRSKDEVFLCTVSKYLMLKLIDATGSENSTPSTITFKATFSPPKKIVAGLCELQICNAAGGLWILPLKISANSSAPDDIITIESIGLDEIAQTSFHLTSTCQEALPFTSYFVSGSDSEISVTPTSGTLEPCNTDGTRFTVCYKPTTYGKHYSAKFIVQCDVGEWCYEIIGKIPNVKYSHSYNVMLGPEANCCIDNFHKTVYRTN